MNEMAEPLCEPGHDVGAVVAGGCRRTLERCLEAVARQTQPVASVLLTGPLPPRSPDGLRVAASPGDDGVSTALRRATETGVTWLWVLDAAVVPAPDALTHLLSVASGFERAAEAPLIVAGMVVNEAGAPIDSHLPRGLQHATAEVVRLAPRGILPIRNAPLLNVLVHRQAVATFGVPKENVFGPHAPVEWTARVLREARGYLVPASAATLVGRPGPNHASGLRALSHTVRMSRAGAWTQGETVRAIVRLVRPAEQPRR